MGFTVPETYQLLKEENIAELNSAAYILRHKKTGAKLFLLSNEDENKVFTVGFRTPLKNSTGLQHILEHSVLCGSRKFPTKDPFVELVKGSLNTFINAMTYPDKTIYPVASCNDKDFQNLMDVYMDAAFYPNIYKSDIVFRQEGWHYELENPEAPITINGVVYNEMKGALSSPESLINREVDRLLYPDTIYSEESGGDPQVIPTLSYEEFLDFHHRYYHPSNSYIYLYGNMDMAEKLEWLDKEYLARFDALEIDSTIPKQQAFTEPVEKEIFYPVTEEEKEDENYFSEDWVVGTDLEPELYVAFQILEYALLGAPGAILKKALLDAGIGKDVYGGYDNGILQPSFGVTAKGVRKEQKADFLRVIRETLENLVQNGLNAKSLLAGINYYEFKYREADYGSFPKGLMYGIQCFDSWLYEDDDPLMHLKYQATFDGLKEKAGSGYFESLIQKYLLDNPHRSVLVASPKQGLLDEADAALEAKLADYKATLSAEELEELVRKTNELKEYQETPSTQEELESIPMLSREDIGKEAAKIYNEEKWVGGTRVLHHELFTSGIGYLRLLFDTRYLGEEDFLYLGLLKGVLGYIDTEHYTYQDLFDEINIQTGGIVTGLSTYPVLEGEKDYAAAFEVHAKALYEKLPETFDLIREILCTSKLGDTKRLYEIIAQMKSRAQMKLVSGGHSAAVLRATSYFSESAYVGELTGGIAFFRLLEDLEKNFEEKKDEIVARLTGLTLRLFAPDNMMVSFTADADGYEMLPKLLEEFKDSLCGKSDKTVPAPFVLTKKNEGFKSASQVQYVARCGNFRKAGYDYTGALRILKVILNYDYLWIQLRLKGGAYGCMSGFGRSGEGYFVSYRDPNLAKTNEVYLAMPEYLKNIQIEDRDMTKYIIGTISDLDVPKNPAAKGAYSLSAWISGVTEEMLQKERDEILTATVEDIRKLSGICQAILDEDCICVVGNDRKIEEEKELFAEVSNLF